MATISLQFTADLFAGTADVDSIDVGASTRLTFDDTLAAGAGVDTLRFVTTSRAFDGACLAGSSGWDRLDFTAATTALGVRLTSQSVAQSDAGVLTLVIAGSRMELDTSTVGDGGLVLIEGTGLVTLRNFAGQSIGFTGPGGGSALGGTTGDQIRGGEGADSVRGAAGDDSLAGGGGADTLDGGAGSDRMTIGHGDDRVTGGEGDDLFIVQNASGAITITDFSTHSLLERIDLQAFAGATSRAALSIVDTQNGALIQLDGTSLTLTGVAAADLGAEDFLFSGGDAAYFLVAAGTAVATLQALIDNAPVGAVIELAAGDFFFSDTLTISRGDITVRGAGVDLTRIVSTLSADTAKEILYVGDFSDRVKLADLAVTGVQGADSLTLSSTAALQVGDVIYLSQRNDEAWLAATGNDGLTFPSDYEAKPDRYALREVLVRIEAIDGNTVRLSHALPYTFEAGVAEVKSAEMLRNIDIGGFTVQTQFGAADPFDFTNRLPAWSSISAIAMDAVSDSRISDVVVRDAASRGITFVRSFDIEGDALTVLGAHNKGDGGNGYGIYLSEAFAVDLTNVTVHDTRHAVLTSSFSAEHYNSVHVLDTNRDVNFHGSPDADNVITVDRMVQAYQPGGALWAAVAAGAPDIHPRSAISENMVTFRYLRAGARDEDVTADDRGGDIDTGVGHDRLRGGRGADTLGGGANNDTLSGGDGRDIFVRAFGGHFDTVTDFTAGAGGDLLRLQGYGVQRFEDLLLVQDGADVRVDLGQDGWVRLQTVQVAQLTAANFQFTAAGQARTVVAQGGSAQVMGSDGADHITIGRGFLTDRIPVHAGQGRDVVAVSVGSFASETATWGLFNGVDVLDFSGATSLALTFHDAIFHQADSDVLTLRFGASAAVTLNVGAPSANGRLVLDGEAAVQLTNARAHNVSVADTARGRVTGAVLGDTLSGGALSDSLSGGGGDDVLSGGLGTDTLVGGAGADTASWAAAAVRVVANLAAGTARTVGADQDVLAEIENLVGSAFDDGLTGDAGANRLTGGLGADALDGGGGNDTLDGGAGADTASYATAGAAVVVALVGFAQDTGGAGVDTLVGIEHLAGSSFDDGLRGDGGANSLTGGAGRDFLTGGLGDDTLSGGQGGDTANYGGSGANGAVTVDLAILVGQATGGAGVDTLASIENVTGTNLDDVLRGDEGGNALRGQGGADAIEGRGGADILFGVSGADTLRGGEGGDNVSGGTENDLIFGDGGNDKLAGDEGDDTLSGGLGADGLSGGAGADRFVFASLADSTVLARDTLRDFDVAGGDLIDLAGIDAVAGTPEDDAFTIVSAFSNVAGQLRVSFAANGKSSLVEGDVDGDGVADFAILVQENAPLSAGDFVL